MNNSIKSVRDREKKIGTRVPNSVLLLLVLVAMVAAEGHYVQVA